MTTSTRIPTPDQAAHYLAHLRDARAAALQDAEGFHPLFQAFEGLGQFIGKKKETGLARYRECLRSLVFSRVEDFVGRFDFLFSLVHRARNEVVHEGTFARTLTQHATDLALLLETVLMTFIETAEHYMVSQPVIIEPWQNVGDARRLMLRNSFSFLPIKIGQEWRIITDFELVQYSRHHRRETGRIDGGLNVNLEEAIGSEEGQLKTHSVQEVSPATLISELSFSEGLPVLVIENSRLEGIITPFDML